MYRFYTMSVLERCHKYVLIMRMGRGTEVTSREVWPIDMLQVVDLNKFGEVKIKAKKTMKISSAENRDRIEILTHNFDFLTTFSDTLPCNSF